MSDLRDPQDIRIDIERSREELGAAVEALAAKLDVKATAREKLKEGRRFAASVWAEHRVLVIAAGAVAVLLVVQRARTRSEPHVTRSAA